MGFNTIDNHKASRTNSTEDHSDKNGFDEVSIDYVNILGVHVHLMTIKDLHREIENLIKSKDKKLILNVNAHCLNLAYNNRWLRNLLNSAELVFCDGAGVILGGQILGFRIPARITYAEWVWQFAEFAEPRGFTFFLLGARPGVADKAADRLLKIYPNLRIVGVHHGYFDKAFDSAENRQVINQINETQPNILIVGFGMPIQEQWLIENWKDLHANVALTGGAVFDYVSGELRRSPRWMHKSGLEWLGRLVIEPGRLWRRYLIGNPLFLWRVLKQRYGFLHVDGYSDPFVSCEERDAH